MEHLAQETIDRIGDYLAHDDLCKLRQLSRRLFSLFEAASLRDTVVCTGRSLDDFLDWLTRPLHDESSLDLAQQRHLVHKKTHIQHLTLLAQEALDADRQSGTTTLFDTGTVIAVPKIVEAMPWIDISLVLTWNRDIYHKRPSDFKGARPMPDRFPNVSKVIVQLDGDPRHHYRFPTTMFNDCMLKETFPNLRGWEIHRNNPQSQVDSSSTRHSSNPEKAFSSAPGVLQFTLYSESEGPLSDLNRVTRTSLSNAARVDWRMAWFMPLAISGWSLTIRDCQLSRRLLQRLCINHLRNVHSRVDHMSMLDVELTYDGSPDEPGFDANGFMSYACEEIQYVDYINERVEVEPFCSWDLLAAPMPKNCVRRIIAKRGFFTSEHSSDISLDQMSKFFRLGRQVERDYGKVDEGNVWYFGDVPAGRCIRFCGDETEEIDLAPVLEDVYKGQVYLP